MPADRTASVPQERPTLTLAISSSERLVLKGTGGARGASMIDSSIERDDHEEPLFGAAVDGLECVLLALYHAGLLRKSDEAAIEEAVAHAVSTLADKF